MPSNVLLFSPGLGYINRGFESLTREIYLAFKDSSDINISLYQGTGDVLDGAVSVMAPKRNSSLYDCWPLKSFRYRQYLSYNLESLFFSLPIAWHAFLKPCDVVYFSDPLPADILFRLRKIIGGKFKLLFCNGAPASPEDYRHYDFVPGYDPFAER